MDEIPVIGARLVTRSEEDLCSACSHRRQTRLCVLDRLSNAKC